jgi:hypothetical protein
MNKVNYNIAELSDEQRQAIEFYRLDCLTKNKLKQYRDGRITREQLLRWVKSINQSWLNSDNRYNRIITAINKIK